MVISTSGVIHISRANAPHCKVECDCGRTIEHRGNISSVKPEELEACDGKTVRTYDRWDYKICQRCGTKDDFVKAQEESIRLLAKKMAEEWDRKQEELAKLQAAVRATMAAEFLYGKEGIDDIVNEDWSILFTFKGMRYKITAEEPPCPSE